MSEQPDLSNEPTQRITSLLRESTIWLVALAFTVIITAILSVNVVRTSSVSAALNEVATDNIYAPFSQTYTSEIQTQQAREQAANNVQPVYTSADLSVGRTQKNRAEASFNFINTVVADQLADFNTKIAYLRAIEGITIEEGVASGILTLSKNELDLVREDVLRIIEDSMRQDVRENNLADIQRLARRQVSLSLTSEQERVVTTIAPQFIVPNTFLDQVATDARRDDAIATVAPVVVTIAKNQQIINVGHIYDAADLEMLQALGLMEQELDLERLVSVFTAVLLGVTLVVMYWQVYNQRLQLPPKQLLLFGGLILLFTLGAKIMVPSRSYISYLYPASALSMLLAVLFDSRLSLIVTIVLATLVGYIASDSLEMTVFTSMGSLLAVLVLRDAKRINAFFRAGSMAAIANVAVIIVFRLPLENDPLELLRLMGLGFLNGYLAAGLTLAGLYFADSIFGATTTVLRLQELSRLDHPLLRELLRKAPGTYHHSIMVANLAEQAAEAVGANGSLVRVGAFYHDIGKMNRPPFFTENQGGVSPHDSLDPYSSARIIISHVTDGVRMGKQYKLPKRIIDFIAEHHGSGTVGAFYAKALAAVDGDESKVDRSRFRYPGPRPQSRETGIVLLADSIDATSNALRPDTEAAIEKLVTKIIDSYLAEGQLDDSELTLGDLKKVRTSFIETLQGRFHVRIKYPGNDEMMADESKSVGKMPASSLPISPPQIAQLPVASN
jgi:putative nucleotidyltransferase with HDIG domain